MYQDNTCDNNLPLNPTITAWLDFLSKVFEGKEHLERSTRSTPYPKGQYPDLDWMAEEASCLLNEMAANPKLFTSVTHQVYCVKD
jgi:hypothetical protein